jgi:ABC-type cobalamin transport system permease subunit
MEIVMVRSFAVVLTIAGLAVSGGAQANSLKSDRKATPVAYQSNGTEVAEVITVNPRSRAVQTSETRAPRPRIYISMGFGF